MYVPYKNAHGGSINGLPHIYRFAKTLETLFI